MNDVEAKPTVYITEGRSLDFSPATVFGSLRIMELGRPVPYAQGLPANMAFNSNLSHRIRKELSDYIPGHDLICPTGAPNVMIAVGTALGSIKGRHRILGWDNHAHRYIEYQLEVA